MSWPYPHDNQDTKPQSVHTYFNPKRKPEVEYLGVVTSFETVQTGDGQAVWVFGVTLREDVRAIYPHSFTLEPEDRFKLRNLLSACHIAVPKRSLFTDPNVLIGKEIGVCLEDYELPKVKGVTYRDKPKSIIGQIFPADEYEG